MRKLQVVADTAQFCVICAGTMPFERVDAVDHAGDETAELVCVACGYALLVDPLVQELDRSA
ncbi:hypothetical protein HPO96_36545 [Kribbella sandramycini]|uniref:Uncharacterized protein n=1 Tax=Kribbella sandramycini TaxID=60450 RepID=A0A7Y4P502_9ACTN|nr:hypothetical protein [Kribbella sandramycini]MBB6567232.1 hypothetical protein [Kribbella sandramycini]NOL45769.1 hypothetical protein [Kribbella sandramycini]